MKHYYDWLVMVTPVDILDKGLVILSLLESVRVLR